MQMKLQTAHTKLSHSRAFIVRAYPLQTYQMLFDAHQHAFRVLGGVPQRGIYDNMKTAVDRIGTGKARQVKAHFPGIPNGCRQSASSISTATATASRPPSQTGR